MPCRVRKAGPTQSRCGRVCVWCHCRRQTRRHIRRRPDEKKKEEKRGCAVASHCINCRYITPTGQVTFSEYGVPRDYSVSSTHSIFVPMSKSNGGGASKLPCGVACATWLTASLSLVGDPCVAAGPASRVPSSLRGALATSGRDVGRRQGGSRPAQQPRKFSMRCVCSVLQLVLKKV